MSTQGQGGLEHSSVLVWQRLRMWTEHPPGCLPRLRPGLAAPIPSHPGSEDSANFQEAPSWVELGAGLLSGCTLLSKALLL